MTTLPKAYMYIMSFAILVLLFVIGGTLHFGWLRGEYDLFMTEFYSSFDAKNWMLDFMVKVFHK